MTKLKFYKYQGTGNDFVMVDNRDLKFPKKSEIIKHICDRRFGVGADGLILLENDSETHFKMVYYNAEGNESTMCGNGGRCIISFAHFLKIFQKKCVFMAIDGKHEGEILNEMVKLKMIDVNEIQKLGEHTIINTGSPHLVKWVKDIENFQVYENGRKIRNSDAFYKEGINVNFVEEISENEIFVRTYERGVENETYSCGTGVTAAAITYLQNKNQNEVLVKVLGGNLKVYLEKNDNGSFINIWLEGPSLQVFEGEIWI